MTERTVSRWLDGPLSLDGAFLPFTRVSQTLWRAQASAASTAVDVDVVCWGDGGAEVTVHPARRPLLSWGARRETRYFDEAHSLADRVAESLRRPSLVVGGDRRVSGSRDEEDLRLCA